MRKKHRVGISVPHLLRPYIDILVIRINIDKKLCCIKDLVDSMNGMLSPYDREKRDSIKNEKERARDLKEVAHHEVCRPRSLKF